MSKAIVKTVSIPSFTNAAKTLGKAYESFDAASAKLSATVCATFAQYLDACTLAGVGKTEKEINAIGKAIRENEIVAGFVASGAFERKTFTEYAQSAMRAYYHGVEFAPGLKNDKGMALPWGGAKSDKVTKAGPSTKTTIEAAHKTMAKALEQYRTMLQRDLVADLLDVIQARFPDFDETAK
jgi:hypothetical protein